MYLNDAHSPRERPARDLVAQLEPDAVELCVYGRDGVLMVRELMRELDRIGRRDVSIVVRRMD